MVLTGVVGVTGQLRRDHPAPYPAEIPRRLFRMFSFAGDTVLDSFAGTGSTALAAIETGRNSVSVEIEAEYVALAEARLRGSKLSGQFEVRRSGRVEVAPWRYSVPPPSMAIEEAIVADLTAHGYHPRTSSHSDLQSAQIVSDLLEACPLMRERALKGQLVAKLRHHQQVGHDDWVIDLALGTSAGPAIPPEQGQLIRFAPPAIIQVAVELKSISTEHGKARRNRLRDFNAFHGYAHSYDPKTIAGAFLVINAAEYFYSPLRKPDDITHHGGRKASARDVAAESVKLFRTIFLRNSVQDSPGLEAIAVVVIEHDNLPIHPDHKAHKAKDRPTRSLHTAPGPQVGDPMHYQTFIRRICSQYVARFA